MSDVSAVQIDQLSDMVTKHNGTPITPVNVSGFIGANSGYYIIYDGDEYVYWLVIAGNTGFSIEINGNTLNSQIFTGRPPVIHR